METETKKEILKICMSKGFLLDKEVLETLSELEKDCAKKIIEIFVSLGTEERVITKKMIYGNFEKIDKAIEIEGKEIQNFFASFGIKKIDIKPKEIEKKKKEEEEGVVKVIYAPQIYCKKLEVKDFVNHFKSRYLLMKRILEEKNLENLTSLRRIGDRRESYTVIVSILDKRVTKNKNLLFEVEDMTGCSRILVNQNKKELYEKAKDLLYDEIVAFSVSGSREILFANDVIFPDSYLAEKKRYNKEEWAAFSSDIHLGSKMFLEKNFLRFIKWLNGEEGDNKQRGIANKIKYLFLIGDNVDGVGQFPGQEPLLNIKDMESQYKKLTEMLKLIRKDIKIIICPGQHDAVWVGEPQPIIGEKWAPDLYKMENVTLLPNPAVVEIDGGFQIMLYHGASIIHFIDEIEYIRLNYKHNSPTKVTKEMLKRRHLAPMHGSVDYIPGEEDYLAIKHVPDILATGDQHRAEVSSYNNILLITGSCWQSITPFEEKVGNNPEPCRVPLFNLKTREIKIVDFSDEDTQTTLQQKKEKGFEEKHKIEVENLKKEMGVKNENRG